MEIIVFSFSPQFSYPRGNVPGAHWVEGLLGHTDGPNVLGGGLSCLYKESNCSYSVAQLVVE